MDPIKLSLGKFKTFLQCPLKYKLAHIDKIPTSRAAGPGLSFYKALTTALQYFHKEGTAPIPSLEFLLQLLERNWDTRGFEDPGEEKQYKGQAVEILKNFYGSFKEEQPQVKFAAGTMVSFKTKRCLVSSRVDRIDQLPDGTYELINYKTGKSAMEPAEMARDLQAVVLYQGANAHKRFEGKVSKVSFYYLRHNRKVSVTPSKEDIKAVTKKLDETALDIAHLARSKSHLNKAARRLMEKTSSFLPIRRSAPMRVDHPEDLAEMGPLCSTCEFLPLCPAWPVKPRDLVDESPELFKQRLRLSYSKLSSYKRCPRAWKKLYIDGAGMQPRPFFSFGTAVHEAMESFYDPQGRRDPSLKYLLKCWDQAFEKYQEGYRDDEERKRYYDRGRELIERYHQDFAADGKYAPAFSIEKYFEIPLGKNAVMTGYIDRIDRLEDNLYEILDYKTEPSRRAQEQIDKDDQLTIYYWAAQTFMRLPIKQLSLLMMYFGEKMVTTRKEEDIPEVVAQIDAVAAEIKENVRRHQEEHDAAEAECDLFPPRKNRYCKGCDHLETCSLKSNILGDKEIGTMEYEAESNAAAAEYE